MQQTPGPHPNKKRGTIKYGHGPWYTTNMSCSFTYGKKDNMKGERYSKLERSHTKEVIEHNRLSTMYSFSKPGRNEPIK